MNGGTLPSLGLGFWHLLPNHVRLQPSALTAADRQLRDDAVQGPQFLLRDLATLQEVTDVAHRARTLLLIAEEAASIELIDQVHEKVLELPFICDARLIGHQRAR